MYKIPTKSEVSDKNYRRSVDIEKAKRELCFSFLFSDCYAHNSMNNMIRRDEEVDAKKVRDNYVKKAIEFKEKLFQARNEGYLVNKIIDGWSSVHPNISFVYNSRIQQQTQGTKARTLNEDLVTVTPMTEREISKRLKGGNYSIIEPVNYSYNPTELAISEVSGYLEAIKKCGGLVSNIVPLLLLSKIKSTANEFNDNANLRLFEYGLFEEYESPFSIEYQSGTEANSLRIINEKIAEKSDAYLKFDELYFVIKTGENRERMIPFNRMLDDETYKESAFEHIKLILNKKGKIIINGQEFGREVLEKSPLLLLTQ